MIFTGSGCTAAVNTLVRVLGLPQGAALPTSSSSAPSSSQALRPVVFVGAMEHHSNLLPWRESGAEVVTIPMSEDGAAICEFGVARIF